MVAIAAQTLLGDSTFRQSSVPTLMPRAYSTPVTHARVHPYHLTPTPTPAPALTPALTPASTFGPRAFTSDDDQSSLSDVVGSFAAILLQQQPLLVSIHSLVPWESRFMGGGFACSDPRPW